MLEELAESLWQLEGFPQLFMQTLLAIDSAAQGMTALNYGMVTHWQL